VNDAVGEYARPAVRCTMARMQMTPMVRFALYFLRIYLILMLLLILYHFIRTH